MLSRTIILCIFLTSYMGAVAQLMDDFSDGDLTTNPAWTGDLSEYQITEEMLNSNGPSASSELYLSTPSSILHNVTWEFFIEINGSAPSGSNKVRVYLVADAADLEGAVNGYYLEIGQSGDDFLNLKLTDSNTPILSGNTVFSDNVRVKVIRSATGNWSLYADHTGGSDFALEGAVVDITYSTTSHFGVIVNHTSSRNDDFFFDDIIIKQLGIDTIVVNSATELSVYFDQNLNEADIETLGNYAISGLNITNASQSATSDSVVTITLDPATPLVTQSYQLSVGSGLTKNDPATYDFSYTQLDLSTLLTTSSTEIKLEFNDELSESVAETLANYTIDNGIGQPTGAVLQPEQKSVVLSLANELAERVNYQLTVSNLSNQNGNSSFAGSENFDFVIPLIAETVTATSNQNLQVTLNKAVTQVTAEVLTNYTLDGGVGNPVSVELSEDGKQVSLEFGSEFGDETYQLTIASLQDLDGNTISGTVPTFDYLNLAVSAVAQSGDNGIQVTFNQTVQEVSAEQVGNYSLSEFGNPSSAERSDADDKVVILTWDELYNSSYTLTISNVANVTNNSTLSSSQSKVSVEKASSFRDLIINEIMADPSPSVGLPVAEFVEVYNPNDCTLNVNSFTINGKSLGAYIIGAKEYLLLTATADSASFGLTNSLGVSGFDALTNTGETITLADQFGTTLDSVAYELSWYRDEALDDGGHSLELIDPLQPCSGAGNWNASTATAGGTPGLQNAIFNDVDVTSPTLIDLEVIGNDSLKLTFSESLESSTINVAALSIDGYTITSLTAENLSEYLAILSKDLVSERSYELVITNVADCRGNTTSSQAEIFYHDTKPPVLEELIIMSEDEIALLFDEPLNESRAESEDNFVIDGLTIDRALLQDSAAHRVHVSIEESFVLGSNYQLEISGLRDTLFNEITQISRSFTFSNDIDTAIVIAPNLLEIIFSQAPANASLLTSNFFLEDSESNPTEAIKSASNDLSIRLAFAENFSENRDLLIYISNIISEADASSLSTPAVTFQYDTRAPNFEEVMVKNDSQLIVVWNEPMNIASATTSSFYTLEDNEQPISITTNSSTNFELTFANKFPIEVKKELSAKGLKDISGNLVTTTRRQEFTYDPRAPLVQQVTKISEDEIRITFNEAITLGSALDLNNYYLESVSPVSSLIFGPDSTSIQLKFASIVEQANVEVQTSDMVDRFGNVSDTIKTIINSQIPQLVDVLFANDSTLQLVFSHKMNASAFETSSYQLDGFVLSEIEKIDDSNVRLTLSEPLEVGDSVRLTANSIAGQNGFDLANSQSETTFNSYFLESQILDCRTVLLSFDTEFGSISISQFSLEGSSVELALVDGDEKGQIRLSLAQPLAENTSLVLSWERLTDRYNRSLPDYRTLIDLDTEKPEVESIESDFFGQLIVEFSEPMDASIGSLNKYQLIELGYANSIEATSDTTVRLDFDNELVSGNSYQLIVNTLPDLAGNYSITDTISFTYEPPAIPSFGEVIITELLPDPSPSIGLPEVEYIEIYNRSDKTIDLKALSIGDASKKVALPSYELAPGAYALIVSAGNESVHGLPNVIGVSGLLTLSNSADQVILFNILDEQVDAVNYSIDWYSDELKDDGGYSLEMIDPLGDCPSGYNWSASVDESGGTPGVQNSIYRTRPDGILPTIQQFELTSEQTIEITFSHPMDSASLVNADVSIAGLEIASLEVSPTDQSVLVIELSTNLTIGTAYSATISGAQDCDGDEMLAFTFDIGRGKVPEAGDLIINEIMADPEPVVGLPNSEYVELYNPTDQLLDLTDVFFRDATTSRQLESVHLSANSYLILCPNTALSEFNALGNAVGLTSWPSLTNSGEEVSLRVGEVVIASVEFSADWYGDAERSDGGYSLELINPFSECPSNANWGVSQNDLGGTPGAQNSNYSLNPDSEAPTLLSSEALDESALRFVFSETMDSLSLINSFTISDLSIESREVVGSDFRELNIFLATPLPKGETSNLTISGASDCSGNVMASTTFMVGFGDTPAFNELLITEIMADPDPVFGLPNSEYLELYNASDRLLSLEGLMLVDASDTTSFPSVVIPSGEYLLLLPTSSVASYPFTENKIGLSGWLSLANGGERLSIRTEDDLIFTIAYDDDWYGEAGSDGGYSLEMRDVTNPCAGEINWGINISAEGGTPGYLNSNSRSVPDNFGPNLTNALMLTDQSVRLTFDEPLAYDFRTSVSLTFEPNLNTIASTTNTDRTDYIIVFESEVPANTPYVVTVNELGDCLNNPIRQNSATFVRPDEADSLDIVINEVLFNPRTNGVDFVELYNRSDKYLDLNAWKLGRIVESEIQTSLITAPYVIAPAAYVAITSDTLILRSEYPQGVQNPFVQNKLPTMANDEGMVILIDESDLQIDRFDYFDDYHLGLLQSLDGVSLERISFDGDSQDQNNWTSASSAVGFATPGYANSQSYEAPVSTAVVTIEPKVFVPQSTNPAFQSFTTINYALDKAGQFANITVYNQSGQPVAELARGTSLSTSGFIRWDGITQSGNRARMGYYVILFEIFDSNGNQQVLKETVVVGR
ncbi:MAG: lamin tail domain-containing protein [Cyclobacteriaceae bacterium]